MTPLAFNTAKKIEKDYQKLIGDKLGYLTYKYIITLPESINVGFVIKMLNDGDMNKFNETTSLEEEENEKYLSYIITEDEYGEIKAHDLVVIFTDLFPDFKGKYLLS